MKNGETQIELFTFPEAPRRLSHPEAEGLRHIAFQVSDIQQVCEYLEKKGVKTEPPRTDAQTGKRYTFFQDPDKLPLEIYETK